MRCWPCSLVPKDCLSLKIGQFPTLFSVNIFSLSIIGGKLKAEKHTLRLALRSTACGGASRRCAAPSAAARRFAPPLRGARRPARCARSHFWNTKKKPLFGGGVQTMSSLRVAQLITVWSVRSRCSRANGPRNEFFMSTGLPGGREQLCSMWRDSHSTGRFCLLVCGDEHRLHSLRASPTLVERTPDSARAGVAATKAWLVARLSDHRCKVAQLDMRAHCH